MKKSILYIIGITIIFGAVYYFMGTKSPTDTYFYIRTGSTYKAVTDSLVSKGILKTTFYFDMLNLIRNYDKNIKPGRYKIEKNMSLLKLFGMLRSGHQEPIRFVINKYRTKEDLVKHITKNFECDSSTVHNFIFNNDSLKIIRTDTTQLLSLVIPNTYLFYWNAGPKRILIKLRNEQQLFWMGERSKKAKALGLTPAEIYALASIVEEETNLDEDKGNIASVYLNRLRKGMKLQADPTVKYAMKDFKLKRILMKHLSFQSPYNTYVNKGLPPGPICTPSINTIDAVLESPETKYLYFVAKADFSGRHDFSEGYEEHLIKAKAYQEVLSRYLNKKNNQPN